MTETEMKKPLPTSQVSKANTEAYKSPIDDSNKNGAEKPDSARDNREKDNIEKDNIEKDNRTKDKTTGSTRNEPGNPNTDSPVANFVNHLIDTA